jgi:hypothetical protein
MHDTAVPCTLSRGAISAAALRKDGTDSTISILFSSVILGFPSRDTTLGARFYRQARVRSRIISRSYSANEPTSASACGAGRVDRLGRRAEFRADGVDDAHRTCGDRLAAYSD